MLLLPLHLVFLTYTLQSVKYESHVSNYHNHKNIYGQIEKLSKASITLCTQSALAFYLYHKQIGGSMNMLRNITLVSTLLVVVGNSWATTNLSPAFSIPVSGKMELIIFITPHITQTPTPEVCKEVEFTLVIADWDGSTDTGLGGVRVAVLDSGIDFVPPFVLSPGKLAKVTIPNDESYRKNVSVELIMKPEDAKAVCGPKASAVVIDSAGVPIGGPTKLNEQFKTMPRMNMER